MWGASRDCLPDGGRYVGVQVEADAAQEDGADDLDLLNGTNYGAPVVRVCQVPLFVEAAQNAGPVRWYRGLSRDDVPQVFGEEAEKVGGEVLVCLRREAVAARGFVFSGHCDRRGESHQVDSTDGGDLPPPGGGGGAWTLLRAAAV